MTSIILKKENSWQHLILPLLFVILYGSGFVGAKLGFPYAGPFTFMTLRFGLAASVMAAIALVIKAPWPATRQEWLHIASAGLLGVGVFSVGAYASIERGVPPAVSALIIALNPIVVALAAAPLLGERTSPRQFLGLLIGIVGVYLVLSGRLAIDPSYLVAVVLSVIALFGLACGNLYQKRHCTGMNLFTGGAVQCGACTVAMAAGMMLTDEKPLQLAPSFIFAWLWMALAVSIGAVSILYVMIRRAEISRVASIFFLMPASAGFLAYVIFGQTLDAIAVVGIVVTAVGVFLAQRH